jgi:hypothetical protein
VSVGYALALREVDACSISPRSAFRTPVGIPVTVRGTIQSVATHDASRPEASVKWYHPGSNGHLSQRAARTVPVGHPICSQCFPHRVYGGALMTTGVKQQLKERQGCRATEALMDIRRSRANFRPGGSCPSRNWRPNQPSGIRSQSSKRGGSTRTRWAATTLSRPADTSPSRPGAVPEVNHATVEPA